MIDNVNDLQVSFSRPAEIENPKWYEPQESNSFHQFLRVIITSDINHGDATNLVVFSKPFLPEYLIENNSPHILKYGQLDIQGNMLERQILEPEICDPKYNFLAPGKSVPYVWYNNVKAEKALVL